MIKVGQIYRTRYLRNVMAVTYIDPFVDDIYCILPDGTQQIMQRETLKEGYLLAEYSTWQNAVNSKKFRGEK